MPCFLMKQEESIGLLFGLSSDACSSMGMSLSISESQR